MSGTAALAAARKRRANPQPNVSTSSSISNTYTSSNSSNSKEEDVPKATNPAMLLMQHNMLLQRLQKEVAELKLKDLNPKEETNYKAEYLGLLEEMKEMKKVLLKVQSFSMETNLEVMKLKRTTSNQIDLSSIHITNDMDEIAAESKV
jgi:hypothetical protein